MGAPVETGYQPPQGFVEDTRNPLIDLDVTDSNELWLIQWPVNQPPDFDGRRVSLNLNNNGLLGSFDGSSGKSYEVVSFKTHGPVPVVFISSASEAKIAGKISRHVSLIHYPEPGELQKQNRLSLSMSQRSSLAALTRTSRRPTPTRTKKPRNSQATSGYSTPSSRSKSSVSGSEEPRKRKRLDDQKTSTDHSSEVSGKGNSDVTSTGSLEHSEDSRSKKKKKIES